MEPEPAVAYCSGHKRMLPRADFYAASLRAGESRCKRCSHAAQGLRRKTNVLDRLINNWYQAERARGVEQGARPTAAVVRKVLERYGNTTCVPAVAANDPMELSVTRFYVDLALCYHPWNAVLLTVKQTRALPRMRRNMTLADYQAERAACFPAALRESMAAERNKMET